MCKLSAALYPACWRAGAPRPQALPLPSPTPHSTPAPQPPPFQKINGANPATSLLDNAAALNFTVLRVFATGVTPELPLQVEEGAPMEQAGWAAALCGSRLVPVRLLPALHSL